MLKLLVADDEKYDRDAIITILNKEFNELLEIREARNGREAIEISEQIRPDIIIMDIKMPGINGLKAIEEIKKFIPEVYVIILTAYDYFDFAMEAMKNNVKEYTLKPFSRAEIIEKISKAVNFVNTEKAKRKIEIESQEKIYNMIPVLENELSYSIINDNLQTIDYETYMKYLDLNFETAFSMVVQIRDKSNGDFDSESSWESLKAKVGEYVREQLNRRHRAIVNYRFTKEIACFIQMNDYENEADARVNAVDLAVDLRREISRVFDLSVKIGIGRCCGGLELMNKSYREAVSSLEYKTENLSIIHFENISGNYSDNGFSDERLQSGDRGKGSLFKLVEKYIEDNIKEELELEKTAAKFNLSPYYFSRTFKEVLGYNFSDFINIKRINKAKELLKNDCMSIKEICYSVGYSDPNYFSKVFKKYEGLSPTEFKLK